MTPSQTIAAKAWDGYTGPWYFLQCAGLCPNGIIDTVHEDGTTDIAKIVDGQIYTWDSKTSSPIVKFKPHE